MGITKKQAVKKEPKRVTKKRSPAKIDCLISHTSSACQPRAKMSTKTLIENFKENGITVLEACVANEIIDMLNEANEQYYNDPMTPQQLTTGLTDAQYDIIKDYLKRRYPNHPFLKLVGAPIAKFEKNKVVLPYPMPSMDKIKPDTNALTMYKKRYTNNSIVSCKLDGCSGLYSTESGTPRLYTRGDGYEGQDITHLIPYLSIPQNISYPITVRGEFIIPKHVFANKYKDNFANPRNLVTGIIGSKTLDDDKIYDVHFVTYELMHPIMTPQAQLQTLNQLGFEVVHYVALTPEQLTNDSLSDALVKLRAEYTYEIDGLIVTDDAVYPKQGNVNPDHALAFKMVLSDQVAEVLVVDVLWEASKDGYLKPRVQYEPVKLSGATLEFATGFNAKFIEDSQIGIGALIKIVRSGDVIPHIMSTTIPAEHAKMPNLPYHWNETHVDAVLDDYEDNETVQEKNITHFFTTLEVEGLAAGNVRRLIQAGLNTVPKVLHATKQELLNVDGFKQTMVNKIHGGIREKVDKAGIADIMVASNLMGRSLGTKKITLIMETYPTILEEPLSTNQKITKLTQINGIGEENATSFVSNINRFLIFLESCRLSDKLRPAPAAAITAVPEHPLNGKKIVMTKVRDQFIIGKLKEFGATLEDNIGKTTFALIVKSKNDSSNKTEYAIKNNIPMYVPQEFIERYL